MRLEERVRDDEAFDEYFLVGSGFGLFSNSSSSSSSSIFNRFLELVAFRKELASFDVFCEVPFT